jgi:PAS domain S-box-containing protein
MGLSLKTWLSSSISHRIRFYALMLTTVIIVFLGCVSYSALYLTISNNIQQKLNSEAHQQAHFYSLLLNTIAADIINLTKNSFIANGLVDSSGKEVYLVPFLRDHTNSFNVAMDLILVDFQGVPVAANNPESLKDYQLLPEIRQTLEQNLNIATIMADKLGGKYLILASPVIFPPTGQVEGALVAKIHLAQLFQLAGQWLNPSFYVKLEVNSVKLSSLGFVATKSTEIIQAHQTITLNKAFTPLSFHLSIGQEKAFAFANLRWITRTFVILTPFTWLLVFLFTGHMAKRLAKPIVKLNQTAAQIAGISTDSLQQGDEVKQLTRSFNLMLAKLQNSYAFLEDKVVERTQMLQESERNIRHLIKHSPIPMVISHYNGRIEYLNEQFIKLYGYDLEDMQNLKHWQAQAYPDPAYRKQTSRSWLKAVAKAKRNNTDIPAIEYRITCKNGMVRTTEICAALIRDRILVIFNDVTERKQQEEKLRQAKMEAEKANRAKSEFLANMSHEIRTPMNAILGFSSILYEIATDAVQKHYLESINASGKTLLQLINDILDLSKIEAGKFELHYDAVTIKTLLQEISSIFKPKLEEKNIDFILDIDPSVPDTLNLDEIRLRQVLLNLLGNAVKFTHHGFVKLSIKAEPATSEHVNLFISVTDTGIGIAKDQQQKIFSAFTQQENQSIEYGGTGLGLTICKRLIELMDGSIGVSSEAGHGSCFELRLPNIEVTTEVLLSHSFYQPFEDKGHFAPATILLVDDLKINRELIKSYLADYPELTFIEADNGHETLILVSQQQPDLIFMDRRMPGENGDKICQKIKANPALQKIPIIMITASVVALEDQQSPPAYDLQLNKPLNKNRLIQAIQKFVPFEVELAAQNAKVVLSSFALDKAEQMIAPKKLLALLNKKYTPVITECHISGILDIDRLMEISNELQLLADEHNYMDLKNWAQQLFAQAELFDLSHLPTTLGDFKKITQHLENLND